MSIRQSVLGEVAIRNGLEVSGADIEGLLRRLLLYETVTIRSVRLRELPYIVRAFGKDGFLQLLNSGVLKISCEFSAIISPLAKNGIRVLPYGHFTFGMADITDRVGVLGVELRNLQSVSGLKIADRSVIETTVLNKLVRPPSNYMQQLLDQVEIDLRSGTPALQIAIEKQVKTRFGDSAPALAINVEEVEKRTFRIGNNIPELFGISDEISDQILRLAVSAVTHLNHRVAEMSAYSAITGFEESESNLLFGKFAGILRPLNPNLQEDQFTRVATIAGFPELIAGKRVDVERLLTVRDSAELREFRDWLSKLDS
ncbi:MAG: hypothetical protein ACREBQ_03375, partial [Nitrososphaerales archaeon]